MAFANLSFEDAGLTAGSADAWTLASTAALRDIAGYDTEEQSREDFEEEWDSNEDYIFAFVELDLTVAEYETAGADTEAETFEEEWSSNHLYVYALTGANEPTVAAYDVALDEVEDFNEEWDSNEDYLYAFVGPGTDLTIGTYTSDGNEESFETGWDATYLYALSGTAAAAYVGTASVESFEGTWTLMTTI